MTHSNSPCPPSTLRLVPWFLATSALACGGETPFEPSDLTMARVQASTSFTCAVTGDNRAVCWGSNDLGQLGGGSIVDQLAPRPVSGDLRFQAVSTRALARHVCGLATDGQAYCWGDNNFGQLGNGTLDAQPTPQPVSGGLTFTKVAAGWRFSCGLIGGGEAHCWGRGEWGQLGNGLATRSLAPTPVAGGHAFTDIAIGSNNLVCGLTTAAKIFCWGLDLRGGLGSPSGEICTRSDGLQLRCATRPQEVPSSEEFTSVTAGSQYACGITVSGPTLCWGRNDFGQLGSTTTETCVQGTLTEISCSQSPIAVPGDLRFEMVSASIQHTCGVTLDGAAYCWGANTWGQLGDGLIGTDSSTPVPVDGGHTFVTVSAGDGHSCGETIDGELWCWGANDRGQLGTGNTNIGLAPVQVADPVEPG